MGEAHSSRKAVDQQQLHLAYSPASIWWAESFEGADSSRQPVHDHASRDVSNAEPYLLRPFIQRYILLPVLPRILAPKPHPSGHAAQQNGRGSLGSVWAPVVLDVCRLLVQSDPYFPSRGGLAAPRLLPKRFRSKVHPVARAHFAALRRHTARHRPLIRGHSPPPAQLLFLPRS